MKYYENEPVSLFLNDLHLIESFKSSKQLIELFNHPWLGKVLIINGEIQHIEKYQALYHELLVHLPATFVPEIKNALIIGGGSLFAANEVLKYPTLKSVTLCDHDHSVLDIMKKNYSHAKYVLKSNRFNYIEMDGKEYILKTDEKYDLVINDCFNLAKESNNDNISYYHMLSGMCSDFGVCVDIIYRHIFDKSITINTLKYLHNEKNIALSLVTVPEYPGILHLETIWGNSYHISQSKQESINQFHKEIIMNKASSPFMFFHPDNLRFYLYLPPYIKNMFNL